MPITPFHFGPGAALHAISPRHVSFLAFCAANVLTDLESLYFLVTGQFPLHRFLHSTSGLTGGRHSPPFGSSDSLTSLIDRSSSIATQRSLPVFHQAMSPLPSLSVRPWPT